MNGSPVQTTPIMNTVNNYITVNNTTTRSWYAQWKMEFPVIINGVERTLKIIGGFTPSDEGTHSVYFRMSNATGTNVFTTDVLMFTATGIRDKSTNNGWQYATWDVNGASLVQISTGSVWWAVGY